MATLLDQCPEVLHNIFEQVEPADLASLAKTCRPFNHFIQNDDLLWKTQYLTRFSDDLELVATGAIDLVTASTSQPTKNEEFLSSHFATESNISAFLCRSSLFAHARASTDIPAPTESLRQLSAKLHVFYGLEVEPPSTDLCNQITRQVHPYARSRVYDLRRYNEGNLWGPFMDDGSQRVDWEKVQSIMIDLLYNLRMYAERRSNLSNHGHFSTGQSSTRHRRHNTVTPGQQWDVPFHGLAADSYTSSPLSGPLAPPLNPSLDAQDPYGVAGTWMRVVCFLDYNDLYAFNFESGTVPLHQEREPISTREAFRLIRLQLHVTEIEKPGEDDDPNMPVVHFSGASKSTYMSWDPNANSRIRGTVRTTRSGAIRWTSFSIFHGEERWRSEGVQIGGIRSARGILGSWFDKDYDVHGPAGPTAFWKVSDDIAEEKPKIGPGIGVGIGVLHHMPWHEVVTVVFDE